MQGRRRYKRHASSRSQQLSRFFSVGLLALVSLACSSGGSTEGGSSSGRGGTRSATDKLKSSDACATLTRYAYRGIPATYIDDGADLLYILAGSFSLLDRPDISTAIEAVVDLTYQGATGQLAAKSQLMRLSDLHCASPRIDEDRAGSGMSSPSTSGSSTRSNSQTTPTTFRSTFPPETTIAPTTTLSPEQLRSLAEQSFERLARGYSGVTSTQLIDSCNRIHGLLVRNSYLEHYEYLIYADSWMLLSSMDFPGPVLRLSKIEVFDNNEPEFIVLWDSSFDESDLTFGTVVGSSTGGCDWRKIPAFQNGVSFPTGIPNAQIVAGKVTGTDLEGNPTSYSYDASTVSFRQEP